MVTKSSPRAFTAAPGDRPCEVMRTFVEPVRHGRDPFDRPVRPADLA